MLSRLILTGVLFIVLIGVYLVVPFQQMVSPERLDDITKLKDYFEQETVYVTWTADKLYYTGYNQGKSGETEGYYYYTLLDSTCYFVLVDRAEGLPAPELTNYPVTARILEKDETLRKMAAQMAADLEWTESGLWEMTAPVYLNAPEYHERFYLFVLFLWRAALIFVMLVGIVRLLVYIEPRLHPSLLQVRRYGSLKSQLRQVNQELEEAVLMDYGKLKITENYVVNLGKSHLFIMPIRHIIWMFRISDFRGIRLHVLSVEYHIHIWGRYGVRLVTSAMSSEKAKEFMQELRQYSDSILVGYTAENHSMAKEFEKRAKIKK